MTVKITKPEINVREKLNDLKKPTGIAGEAMLRADTPQEQFNLIGAGRRNLLINGDMRVAQRGTTSTVANYQTVDRWRNGFSGASVTQSQETVATGDAPFQAGFRKFLRLTQTAAGTAAADFAQIAQRIEGFTAGNSGWDCTSGSSFITVSAWVRSSVAGKYYVYFNTRGSTSGYYNKPFTLQANVWTKVECVISGNSGCFIDFDNSSGIELRFVPYYGTNYTGSSINSNSWYFSISSGELPHFEQNWCAVSGATFDMTGAQLEVGKVATPFEHRSYGEELALCQRYYQQHGGGSYTGIGTVQIFSVTHSMFSFLFPTKMRAAPTFSFSNLIVTDRIAYDSDVTALTPQGTSDNGAQIKTTHASNSASARQAANLAIKNGTYGYLAFNAEL